MNVDDVVHKNVSNEEEWLIPSADVVGEVSLSAPGGQLADCFDSPRKNTTGTIARIEKGDADENSFCEQEDVGLILEAIATANSPSQFLLLCRFLYFLITCYRSISNEC